jgi:HK97 family phage major capsid protein
VSLTVTELDEQIGKFTTKIQELVGVMGESRESDKARWTAADTERVRVAGELETLKEVRESEVRRESTEKAVADMRALLADTRSASKATLIGAMGGPTNHDYESGSFLRAVFESRNQDYATQLAGKASLAALGVRVAAGPGMGSIELGQDGEAGKAVTGATGATGLWIAPNAVVTRIVEIATALNPMRALLNVVENVAAPAVAIPLESAIATRAVIAAWGTLKANEDFAFLQYTATMYTLAKITDEGNQLLRYSQGAAEKNVTNRLGRSMALGEAYYLLNGSGTGEPKGIITALNDAATAYDTSDVAGFATPAASVYGAIAQAIGSLEARNRQVDGAILHPTDFWTYLALEGSAIRPYLNSFMSGAPMPVATDNRQSPLFGIPVIRNSNMTLHTAVVGEFGSATMYTGLGYRIDTSSEAGTRWDYNLTGFRAEEEFGFNATPYVLAGMFQRITTVGT